EAANDAKALMNEWGVGRAGINDGLVILFDVDTSLQHGQVQLYAGPGFDSAFLSTEQRQSIYEDDMLPLLREADFDSAVQVALARVAGATLSAPDPAPGGDPSTPSGDPSAFAVPPGPPFPSPETDRAVYDFAGILSPDAIVRAEATIRDIRNR